ncbi:hypothetical protein K1X12_16030 [Hyphomonas sp. WL0036]|uniref:YiiX/YebB-like N1pC/P60 family cysteine hydrolase n=1 Tax=Hyphomonas sediminis TaxID=2866160 RepID=UPI001C81D8A2|nr:YiiX/YebB-like N1pC/P60 family cysteine hydrolase [Hyphomonas sediminis]MBY9068411.1 hypothetical protein [Hyphomonas sediminis]
MFRQVSAALILAPCLFFGLLVGAREAGAEILPAALPALAPGDLLFKGADTGAGTQLAVAWSLGDKRWGHVGIVVGNPDGSLAVIHADTGARREIGHVRRVSLAEYLSDVSGLGVYGIDLEGKARADYLAYAESAVGRPFDKAFSIESENSLYCSELVWRAMSAGLGEDAIPEKSERLGRIYVSVSDLADHPRVHERAVIKAAAATASH